MSDETRTFSFICPTCGELHEGSPSIAFHAPAYWRDDLAAADAKASRLSDDFCMIERTHYFIRCILEVPIIGVEEPFSWGVWLSQSEANFNKYVETFPESPPEVTFGYFSNRMPFYPETLSLHARAHWRAGKLRPWVELEESDHPLYRDWTNGISWERAIEIAAASEHRRTALPS